MLKIEVQKKLNKDELSNRFGKEVVFQSEISAIAKATMSEQILSNYNKKS